MESLSNDKISKSELEIVLSTFLDRSPNNVRIRELRHEDFGEGFGFNSDISRIHVNYSKQHYFNVPRTVLVKRYKDFVMGITNQGVSSDQAYSCELAFYRLANVRLFSVRRERLFPICYNAITESCETEEVSRTLLELKRRRILVLEELSINLPKKNLDTKIYGLTSWAMNLRAIKDSLQDGSGELKSSHESTASEWDQNILSLVANGLITTRCLHDELKIICSEGRGVLCENSLGSDTLLKKFIGYNAILMEPGGLNDDQKGSLRNNFRAVANVLSGVDQRTSALEGIIHADLHHGNMCADHLDNIRFLDAGNVTTGGATFGMDIAPQVFNPPVIFIPPDEVQEILQDSYLKDDSKTSQEDLVLNTILAGYNWCLKAAAAHAVAKKKRYVEYQIFLAWHPNHEDGAPLYLAAADSLLAFLIDREREFHIKRELGESMRNLRELGQEMHADLISGGKILNESRYQVTVP